MNAQARDLVEAGPHLLGRAVVTAYGHTAVERVELDDGTTLDVVVVGIGITPSTGWLAGSAYACGDLAADRCVAAEPARRKCPPPGPTTPQQGSSSQARKALPQFRPESAIPKRNGEVR